MQPYLYLFIPSMRFGDYMIIIIEQGSITIEQRSIKIEQR